MICHKEINQANMATYIYIPDIPAQMIEEEVKTEPIKSEVK